MDVQCFCKDCSMCLFIIILQIKAGLDNKGEKVDGKYFCKICNQCLCIIFTDKARVR